MFSGYSMKYSELPATTNGARAGVNCPAIAAALGTPAWASAWAALDAGPVADLLRQAESGSPVQLTLCGERNALGFHTAPRSLVQRFQGLFRPMRWSNMLVQL